VRFNPHLAFNGNCQEAFQFYQLCLGGEIVTMLPHEGTPAEAHVTGEWRKKILHASLRIGEQWLMGGDAPPGRYQPPQGFSIGIHTKDPAEADRIFNALSQGGTITMPLQPTFWAVTFGMLTDRFGIPWMVNCEKEVPFQPPRSKP
jgi:PhnB protein